MSSCEIVKAVSCYLFSLIQVLDDATLSNLDVMDAGPRQQGTLLERLDHCSTAFGKLGGRKVASGANISLPLPPFSLPPVLFLGKRLLKQWVSAPLCDPSAIDSRLDAITDLLDNPSLVGETKSLLKRLPDLERLLRKLVCLVT